MNETPHPPASRLEQALRSRQFVITAEITPPVSCSAQDLLEKALPLRGLADAVNVTDGASARVHMSAPIAASILARRGLEPILQLTLRDRNRIALAGELLGAAACGVHNLLCLTGDDPKAGDQPETKAVFDIDSVTLTRIARDLRDKRVLPSGREVAGAANFFIGAADVPLDPPPGWRPDKLAAKVAAGAQFAQTQFCMDKEIVRRYVAAFSIQPTSLLPGRRYCASALGEIRPLDAQASLRDHHPRQLGGAARSLRRSGGGRRAHLPRLMEKAFAAMREVAGVHVMAPANEAALPRVIAAARRRRREAVIEVVMIVLPSLTVPGLIGIERPSFTLTNSPARSLMPCATSCAATISLVSGGRPLYTRVRRVLGSYAPTLPLGSAFAGTSAGRLPRIFSARTSSSAGDMALSAPPSVLRPTMYWAVRGRPSISWVSRPAASAGAPDG